MRQNKGWNLLSKICSLLMHKKGTRCNTFASIYRKLEVSAFQDYLFYGILLVKMLSLKICKVIISSANYSLCTMDADIYIEAAPNLGKVIRNHDSKTRLNPPLPSSFSLFLPSIEWIAHVKFTYFKLLHNILHIFICTLNCSLQSVTGWMTCFHKVLLLL